MLCGASDTELVAEDFRAVVRAFGGESWYFQDGDIVYFNSIRATWEENSVASVAKADLCVFVIVDQIGGGIAWDDELGTALASGKPFLFFCRREILSRYHKARSGSLDPSDLGPHEQAQYELLERLEQVRGLTIVPFDLADFGERLRAQFSLLFMNSLGLHQTRNQRLSLLYALNEGATLTPYEVGVLAGLAQDETEEKGFRKLAITALAGAPVSEEFILALVRSPEQGVSRLALQSLASLYTQRDDVDRFLQACVEVANESDDIGLTRRLIPSAFAVDTASALRALMEIDLTEIGTRRRLAGILERDEDAITAAGCTNLAVALARKCVTFNETEGWRKKCEALISRLSALGGSA